MSPLLRSHQTATKPTRSRFRLSHRAWERDVRTVADRRRQGRSLYRTIVDTFGRPDVISRSMPKAKFDPDVFLASLDGDRTISHYEKDEVVFTQGQPADAIFYIQSGKIKILVTSEQGKEAVVAMPGTGDFLERDA